MAAVDHPMIDLGGVWEILPDPDDRGVREGWASGADQPQGWLAIDVPSAWQSLVPDDGADVAWYRRRITVPEDWGRDGRRIWLRFASVATEARAWVNGHEVGSHTGDWAPFQFEVTDALGGGREALIVVRIDRIRPEPMREVDGAPQQGGHITKGFHDVLSIQHAGIWGDVSLIATGPAAFIPDGVGVTADARTGRVLVEAELERLDGRGGAAGEVRISVTDGAGKTVAQGHAPFAAGATECAAELAVPSPELWSIERPTLYTARVELRSGGAVSQTCSVRFGFRRVEAGGANGGSDRILLNGRPIFVSGILDWGHEPRHMAPAPPREELRTRFAALKALGFNCVCVCMWYPPAWFYDLADEMGMLIWQEHPVWKSAMGDEHVDEYKRQFAAFFRRDRNHPSVAIVSGSCEHERFNPRLAEWWWERARRLMPDRLLQIQTAFLTWMDLGKTDLYDEHTYESSGRWVPYLEDVDATIAEREPKPFVMGESVLYVSWPDMPAIEAALGGERPWWTPRGLDSVRAIEKRLVERYGARIVDKLRRDGDRYHLQGRKFQTETFRHNPAHAGTVMNNLVDVSVCRCGFLDDVGRWRFGPEQTRPWLGEAVLLLKTPDERRGFVGGASLPVRIGVSNFSARGLGGPVRLSAASSAGAPILEATLRPAAVAPGDAAWLEAAVDLPRVDRPTPLRIEAACEGAEPNAWDLWALPPARPVPAGVYRLDALPYRAEELALDFEEKKYSSGWGLPVRSWSPRPPRTEELLAGASPWDGAGLPPGDARLLVTHRLTAGIADWLIAGGRVLLLPSKAKGSVETRTVQLWGQTPLIPEAGPFAQTGTDWVLDLLDYDLARRWTRSVPSWTLGIEDRVDPIVRLLYTHDIADRVKVYDSVFAARVGAGVLVVSTLDHYEEAGRAVLDELLAWSVGEPQVRSELDEAVVRGWCLEAAPE